MSDTTGDDGDFERDFLARRRRDLEESAEYFGSSDYQPDRERLAVRDFLTNLGIAFVDGDLVLMPVDDPVDVSFRGARFQVKEIMDQGRKRGDEYKEALEKARKAEKASDLLVHYTPEDATLVDICNRIADRASALMRRKYATSICRTLDLLFYVNLVNVIGLTETPYPDVSALASLPWRSISFVMGWRACVFTTSDEAPEFLKGALGAVRHRGPALVCAEACSQNEDYPTPNRRPVLK